MSRNCAPLRLVGIILVTDLLDADFHAVLGEGDVLFLHLLHTSVGQLIGVEVDLGCVPSSACVVDAGQPAP